MGPWTVNSDVPEVCSTTWASAPRSAMARRIIHRIRVWMTSLVTTLKSSSPRRVTVRSASMPPAGVAPGRVDDLADLGVDVGRREVVQDPAGVGAGDPELGHERHVHDPDGLAHGDVLEPGPFEGVAPPEGGLGGGVVRGLALSREPEGELPAHRHAEAGPLGHELGVDGAAPDAPGGDRLPVGEHRVAEQRPQQLDGAVRAIGPGGLVAQGPVDVVVGHVLGGHALGHPVGHHRAHAPAEQDPQRVEAGRHPQPVHLRRRPEVRVQVGGEGLRAAEQLLDADVLQGGDRGRWRPRRRGPSGPSPGPGW